MEGQISTINKYRYSWQDFAADAELLAQKVRGRNHTGIFGIPRGGIVLAVVLSYRLGIPLVLRLENITENTLIVDDICDTGVTLEKLKKDLGFLPAVATIFYHKDAIIKPDICLKEKTQWIVFPWETEESSKYDGTF